MAHGPRWRTKWPKNGVKIGNNPKSHFFATFGPFFPHFGPWAIFIFFTKFFPFSAFGRPVVHAMPGGLTPNPTSETRTSQHGIVQRALPSRRRSLDGPFPVELPEEEHCKLTCRVRFSLRNPTLSRAFLNLWFACGSPFTKMTDITKTTKTTKTTETTKTTQTATNKELSAGLTEITETTEMTKNHGNAGCKPRVPQTTGSEIPD